MTNLELVEKALGVYNAREHWTYLQGALGELGESGRARNLYNYFRQKGGNSMTMDYAPWLDQYGRGHHCTDCSNFINYLLGYKTSMYSTEGYGAMPAFDGKLSDAPIGTVLWMQGHVGLVVAKDTFIDFYAYNNTCRKGKISQSLFKKACYIKGVDYLTSKPVKLELSYVSKERYIGDNLTYNDLVCKVTLEDGNVLTNPSGWMYTPTVLTNTQNVIAGTYKELVGYVNIPAKVKDKFYGVQIPCGSREESLAVQSKLTKEGYAGVAVIELNAK